MKLPSIINPQAIVDMGLSRIKNPQLKAALRESIQKYMNSSDPLKAALKGEGLTMDTLRRQGLPMLKSDTMRQYIDKIPGASLLVPMVESFINNKKDDQTIETTSTESTKVRNSFPPIKPR